MARALEAYPHTLAAGDGRGACALFTPAGRERTWRIGDLCDALNRMASDMTPAQRRLSASAQAVRVDIQGDRATAYLRYGDCILRTSGSVLVRDNAGDWRIDRMWGAVTHAERGPCLE